MTTSMSRRRFLIHSSLTSGAITIGKSLRLDAQRLGADAAAPMIPTLDTRMKFNPDGTRRPFRGNTVICHLQQQGRIRDAVEAIRPDLDKASFASKIALLPTASYHMTVYPGANDQGREITGWPSDLSPNASIDECNRVIAGRMRQFHLNFDLPLRMKVDTAKTVANLRATTLRMTGANPEQEAKMRLLRDRLVNVFGYRDRNHAEYGFHITLAYQLAPFTPSEQSEHQAILKKHVAQIESAGPIFEFGNPEFCTFQDMFRFEIELLLAT